MSSTHTYTIPELTNLLASLDGVSFKAESRAEAYDWIEERLYHYKYKRLDKPSKGVVQAYMRKYTIYSQCPTGSTHSAMGGHSPCQIVYI